jgi:hypothetical protein
MIEAKFARSPLLAKSPYREPALLLFLDQTLPEIEPRRLCLRYVASIGDGPTLAKWCSSDAYVLLFEPIHVETLDIWRMSI